MKPRQPIDVIQRPQVHGVAQSHRTRTANRNSEGNDNYLGAALDVAAAVEVRDAAMLPERTRMARTPPLSDFASYTLPPARATQ
jgi:hypothetical protein